MKLKVCPGRGFKPVTAKVDGGIFLEYFYADPVTDVRKWVWNKYWAPVVSIEACVQDDLTHQQSKRKGKVPKNNEDKLRTVSAQIFAELLGQALYGDWTANPAVITHQEAICIARLADSRPS